jgi:hypothetical protein
MQRPNFEFKMFNFRFNSTYDHFLFCLNDRHTRRSKNLNKIYQKFVSKFVVRMFVLMALQIRMSLLSY